MNWRGSIWPAFVLFLLLVIGLHAYLGRYAHPMADDFSYALKDASSGAWDAAAWEYAHWNGRYASNFLVLFGPLREGFDAIGWYRMVPAALLLLTFLGAWTLIAALGHPGLGHARAMTGAVIWTALYAHLMPDMAEGFYWYTGSVTYQLPSALSLFVAALLVRAMRKNSIAVMAAMAVLLVFIIGCNEVIMLLVLVAALLMAAWSFSRNLHRNAGGGFIFLLVLACALLVILAPGNEGRGSLFPDRHRLTYSLGMSALQTGRFLLEWITCPSLFLLTMVWWMNHRRLSQRFPLIEDGFGLSPWISIPALIGVIILCVFPAYWSTGLLGQHRTVNVACFFFIPLWFVNVSVFAARFGGTVISLHETDRRRVTAALLLLMALDFGFTGNSGEAIIDLASGRAEKADEQLWQRYDLLREAATRPDRIATIPFINDRPRSIYVLDLRDRRFLVNRDYAAWFGLKEVRPRITVHKERAKPTN